MGVSGQLHPEGALPLRKELPVPLKQRAGWAQGSNGRSKEEKSVLTMAVFEPLQLGRTARKLATTDYDIPVQIVFMNILFTGFLACIKACTLNPPPPRATIAHFNGQRYIKKNLCYNQAMFRGLKTCTHYNGVPDSTSLKAAL
jgi:hypothetical protein